MSSQDAHTMLSGASSKRPWRYAPAEVKDGGVSAPIPSGARQAYLAAYEKDEGRHHELCGTTTYVDFARADRPQ